ncbi:MAG: ABC transporter permease [Planctomycetes bacterium]|nr:ABC transporter permease [Planctomycetota bacterium]
MPSGKPRGTDSSRERVSPFVAPFESIGARVLGVLDQIGATTLLFVEAAMWVVRAVCSRRVRVGRAGIVSQIVRVGVRSIFIVTLVSGSVGLILALQMAPPLEALGQKDKVANIIGVAIFRELGPLIAAIVLTGFAGAAIAAEIGTMVVGEEVEALQAHALNPVRFLVVPRVIATIVSMAALSVVSTLAGVISALLVSMLALGIPYTTFTNNLLVQVKPVDFMTGWAKSLVFGTLIGVIACSNGLRVTGGAAGVGQATTRTVVQSIVAIVIADLVFTTIFYALDLV